MAKLSNSATSQSASKIQCHIDDDIGTMELSNPGKHNALTREAWLSVPAGVDELIAAGARVIVVRGEGDSFCAGADISEFDTVRGNPDTARIYENANADAFRAVRRSPVPTIAAISGPCFGGGFGLAAACDIRVAATNAVFSVPAAKLGLAYPVEAMADIVHAVGPQLARRMLFAAERFDAAFMLSAGFLSEVHEIDALHAQSMVLAAKIANLAPLTHRATKASIDAALGDAEAISQAGILGDATFTSADYAEGRTAFKEKRGPVFKGR